MQPDRIESNRTGLIAEGDSVKLVVNTERVTVYLCGSGTVSGGTVVVEEAHDDAYTGTWSEIETVTASNLNGAALAVHVDGFVGAVRARVSSAITGGGSVTARVVGA